MKVVYGTSNDFWESFDLKIWNKGNNWPFHVRKFENSKAISWLNLFTGHALSLKLGFISPKMLRIIIQRSLPSKDAISPLCWISSPIAQFLLIWYFGNFILTAFYLFSFSPIKSDLGWPMQRNHYFAFLWSPLCFRRKQTIIFGFYVLLRLLFQILIL